MASLRELFPGVAAQWHPTKNIAMDLQTIKPKSNKKVWWKCSYGHEWEAPASSRTRGKGCPYCAGYYPTSENNFAVLHPDLLSELHPTKNGALDCRKLTRGSSKRVWWICDKGHEWKVPIYYRTAKNGGTGCPFCRKQTSALEIRVFSELKYFYPLAIWGDKSFGAEVDVLISEVKIAIEVDGGFWHADKEGADRQKTSLLELQGLRVVRIREAPLKMLGPWDVASQPKESHIHILKRLMHRLAELSRDRRLLAYKEIVNQALYDELWGQSNCPKISVFQHRPELGDEWNYERNPGLNPASFSYGSGKKVWWKCCKEHEWEAIIASRSRGRNCPYCSGNRVCRDNCLATLYHGVASEWHPTLNGDVTPGDVLSKSGKRYWWLCVERHTWKASICSRTGLNTGCPHCFNLWWQNPGRGQSRAK